MHNTDIRETALAAHRDYYRDGEYDKDRLLWTANTFLADIGSAKTLEIGCGNGALLQILVEMHMDAVGVDASSSGIEQCIKKSLSAQCLDVSSESLPYPDETFQVVISLETFEHLMNPYFALQEVRRILRPGGKFICSVPNPATGHLYLYPGLFEYKNFRSFLEQSGFTINRVEPWQWAPRERFLPRGLRSFPVVNSRIIAGGARRLVERAYRLVGLFPAFCYWLWTFDCVIEKKLDKDIYTSTANRTRPGTGTSFARVD
jgi:SAM-dependent methyltransferase